MFTDERRCNVWDRIRQQDLRGFGRILTPALMREKRRKQRVSS